MYSAWQHWLYSYFSLGMMPGYAFPITAAPGTIFDTDTAAMDAALGIAGFQIGNFEDLDLVNGLSIEYTDLNAGLVTVLPNLYNPSARWQNNPWDGIYALANTPANQDWKVTTFHINGRVAAFGVGFANFQSDRTTHTLFVNGIGFGIIDGFGDFDSGIYQRNMYLIINVAQGESILSVEFGNEANGEDGLVFDHLASQPHNPVSEPSTILLLGISALGLLGTGIRRCT